MKVNLIQSEYEVVRDQRKCINCKICIKECANGVNFYDEKLKVDLSDDIKL